MEEEEQARINPERQTRQILARPARLAADIARGRSWGWYPLAALALVVAGCAASGGSLGVDELTKNGRLVSGVELRQLFTQATVEGRDANGVEYTLRTDDEGTYKGVTTRGDSFVGKWSVNDRGEVCFDTVDDTIRMPCTAQYMLNGKYYAPTPSGGVLERSIRRPSPLRR